MVKRSVKSLAQLFTVSTLALTVYGCGGDTSTNTPIPEVNTADPVSDPVNGWQLVFQDEFDGDSIDMSKWTQEVDCNGGGNQERQCYTEDAANSFVSGGNLNIVALPRAEGQDLPLEYTSARLNTLGKFDFTYGRVEMRAQLPSGQGSWPAFWLLHSNETYGIWPQSGEIDIMEAVNLGVVGDDGVEETRVFGTLHYGDMFPNNQQSGLDYRPPDGINPADGFHTYAIEWEEGEVRWYMDGYLYATQRQSEVRLIGGEANGLVHTGWYLPQFSPITGEPEVIYSAAPFDHNHYIILNLAVGGSFPENSNNVDVGVDATAFENGQSMVVDYVRVYECSVDPVTGKGCGTVRTGWDSYRFEEQGGYDDFNNIADPNGALVRGRAPIPRPPAPPTAQPLTIFADGENPDWPLWDDCCGPAESEVVTDDLEPGRGPVAEFRILDNSGTVLGFNSRNGDGSPYNASALVEGGTFSFDMRIVSAPSQDTWLIKIEGNGMASPAFEVNLNTSLEGVDPVVGEWQTYTFPVSAIADSGLDFSAIDVVMVFPAWQTGEGAVYRIDNVNFGGAGGSSPSLDIFIDENTDFAVWDNCCGPASSAVVAADDPDRGNVVQFEILDNSGTVLGFNSRAGIGGDTSFDASPLFNSGVLQFDMLVVSPPAGDTSWMVKVEGNGIASPAFEVNLNTSMEGADPVTGEWQTYTFPISAIADGGTDISAIDVVLVFPAWQTGEGAVYQLDNVRIYDPNASGGSGPALSVFADGANEAWPLWDTCCGPAESEVVMDDVEPARGEVAEFRILDNSGTVLGFNNRADQGGSGMPFDATGLVAGGKLSFDLLVVSPPGSDTTWMVKVEGNNIASPAFEVALTESNEGQAPVVGEWQTYTFDVLSILDGGTDISAIDVILVFPAWQTGEGAVYRLDNVVFTTD